MKDFSVIAKELAQECFTYDEETGLLTWKHRPDRSQARNTRFTGKVAGHEHTCTVGKKYIQVRVDDKLHYAHRIIWVMMRGEIPKGMQVDHIDGDGTNNRLSNLRLVTDSENKRNQRMMSTNTSGYTGVYLDKRRGTYIARVWEDGKFLSLGRADTAEEAYAIRQAYNRAHGFHENHGSVRPL